MIILYILKGDDYMINPEYELSILDPNIEHIKEKLLKLNVKDLGEKFQKRYVYDFNPVNPNCWIRLRTNGDKTTIAIKEINNKNSIGGISKLETEVGNFLVANEILNRLGYIARNYQENRRHLYTLGKVTIKIDYWPLIPPYVKIEAPSEKEVLETLALLEVDESQTTTLDVQSIYTDIYNIDLLNIRELRF